MAQGTLRPKYKNNQQRYDLNMDDPPIRASFPQNAHDDDMEQAIKTRLAMKQLSLETLFIFYTTAPLRHPLR